jgi:hypothetical protein
LPEAEESIWKAWISDIGSGPVAMVSEDGGGAKKSKDFLRARMLGGKAMGMEGLVAIWIYRFQDVNRSATCNCRAASDVLGMDQTARAGVRPTMIFHAAGYIHWSRPGRARGAFAEPGMNKSAVVTES